MHRHNPFVEIYKKCNNGTNQEKYDLIKSGEIQLPRYLDIELTNCCNFRCHFCPTGLKQVNRIKGYMTDEVVDAIVKNVIKYKIPGVRFIRWGEPTLHPKCFEIIQKMKDTGTMVHINTNGSLLSDDNIQEMLDIGMDSIKISFQGADEGTYNEMREGGDYVKLLDNIKKLHMLRGERKYPYIQISTTLTGEKIEQIESFKSDIGSFCDYYNIGYTKFSHLNVDSMDIDETEKIKIKQLQINEKGNRKYNEVCMEAFDKLSVNWNGDVTLCCSDYDNFMIVGNILDMDLHQIFVSNAADNYRKIILNKELGRIKCCSNCYNIIPLNK